MHLVNEAPFPDHARNVCPGALVRTVRTWPGGIYRAEVSDIVSRDGNRVAIVCGREWFPADLIVLRPPVH
jgi:hypothetical protein